MNLDNLVFEFLINVPAMIALIVGMILTLASWQRHPPAARWAMLAFSWLFLTYIFTIVWRNVGVAVVFANDPNLEEILFSSLIVLSIFEAMAYFFFMVAFNVARTPYRPRHYYEDELDKDFPSQPPERK